MRAMITCFILFTLSVGGVFSQENKFNLDSLEIASAFLKIKIDSLQIKLEAIDQEIKLFENKAEQVVKVESASNQIESITTSEITLRLGPDPTEQEIIKLPKGSKVIVYESKSGYYKIKCNDQVGWVHSAFVQKVDILESVDEDSIVPQRSVKTNSASKTTSTKYKTSTKRRTYVKGHYRTMHGKKVWVKGHYRNN